MIQGNIESKLTSGDRRALRAWHARAAARRLLGRFVHVFAVRYKCTTCGAKGIRTQTVAPFRAKAPGCMDLVLLHQSLSHMSMSMEPCPGDTIPVGYTMHRLAYDHASTVCPDLRST